MAGYQTEVSGAIEEGRDVTTQKACGSNWFECWIVTLSVLSAQARNPVGLLIPRRYSSNIRHSGLSGQSG